MSHALAGTRRSADACARPLQRASVLAALLSMTAGLADAQSGGSFTLTRSRVASGGGQSAGGAFVVRGTAGQHEAQPPATGGAFVVRGGFWTAIATTPPADPLFRDGFEDPP